MFPYLFRAFDSVSARSQAVKTRSNCWGLVALDAGDGKRRPSRRFNTAARDERWAALYRLVAEVADVGGVVDELMEGDYPEVTPNRVREWLATRSIQHDNPTTQNWFNPGIAHQHYRS